MPLNPITEDDKRRFSVEELANRMRDIISEYWLEYIIKFHSAEPEIIARYQETFDREKITSILSCAEFDKKCDGEKKQILHYCFNFFVQNIMYYLDLTTSRNFGTETLVDLFWQKKVNQDNIVRSRISFENFMQIVHLLKCGELLKGKSKRKAFAKFIKDNKRDVGLLQVALEHAAIHDTDYRTGIVHKTSEFTSEILRFQFDTSEASNSQLALHNLNKNLWKYILEIAESGKVTGFTCTNQKIMKDSQIMADEFFKNKKVEIDK